MADSGFISKKPLLTKSQDYAFLRSQGLKYIEQLGHQLWTDYNVHDPGITIMELLCYALTDLGYRTGYDIKDILAEPILTPSGPRPTSPQFHTARNILPSGTVTFDDLRKLLLDVKGVRNAWIEPYKALNYTIDPRTHQFTYSKFGADYLHGLYNVLIEYEKPESPDQRKQEAEKRALQRKICDLLLSNRNVCEDVVQVCDSATEEIAVCANLEIRATANVENLLADIFCRLSEHISPRVRFYSLPEMLAKGKSVEAVFEGPVLEHGFIDDDELHRIKRRCEIRTSDIVNLLMEKDLPDVVAIKNIALLSFVDGKPRLQEDWLLPLATDKFRAPVFSPEKSKIVFYKDHLPYYANRKVVYQILESKCADPGNAASLSNSDLPVPLGQARRIARYYPAQNDMPATYCVGQIRVAASDSPLRKAQSKQLKSYLLFFEQLLANHAAQLCHVNDLFSWDQDKNRGYFSQVLNDSGDLAGLYLQKFGSADGQTLDMSKLSTELDALVEPDSIKALEHRHRFLDHLLARFCEDFSQYHLLMQSMYCDQSGEVAGKRLADEQREKILERLIGDKCRFLEEYPELSKRRNHAYDYRSPGALSGYQHRVYRLIGINASSWRRLASQNLKINDPKAGDPQQYSFDLQHDGAVFTSIQCDSRSSIDMLLDFTLTIGGSVDNYQPSADGKTYELFRECKHCGKKTVIGTVSPPSALRTIVQDFAQLAESEGFHFIEHILLRKRGTRDSVLPVQMENGPCGCPKVVDPYSFRASVVLPAWPRRCRDVRFRRFVEDTLRREAPAHVSLKVCWISHEQMRSFEDKYEAWMKALAGPRLLPCVARTRSDKFDVKASPLPPSTVEPYATVLKDLISALVNLVTVYPLARLYDSGKVNGNEPQITLNNTNLGTY